MNYVNSMRLMNFSKVFPTIHWPRFLKISHGHENTRWPFWVLFVILYFSSGLAAASGAEVTDLVINNSRGDLLLSIKTSDVITKEVKVSDMDEVSSTIVFSIALYQVHNLWFDKKIAQKTATNTIKYNPLKKEYSLLRSWDRRPPLVVGSLDQARPLMTEVKDLKVMPLARLEKGQNYQIRVQAVCQDQNVFIFSPSGCFKTHWHTVDFTF